MWINHLFRRLNREVCITPDFPFTLTAWDIQRVLPGVRAMSCLSEANGGKAIELFWFGIWFQSAEVLFLIQFLLQSVHVSLWYSWRENIWRLFLKFSLGMYLFFYFINDIFVKSGLFLLQCSSPVNLLI